MENLRINPAKYPTIKCECGSVVWNQGILLKKIPGLEVGTGAEDQVLDLPIYYCAKCGKILPEYNELYGLDTDENSKDEKPKTTLIL